MPVSHADANTVRSLEAGMRLLADAGWGGLTPKAVAREAGLSQRAVQSRYATRSHLAAGLWRTRLGHQLQERLEQLLISAGMLNAPPFAEAFTATISDLAAPSAELVAAVELVMVSGFDIGLQAAVTESLGTALALWCTPKGEEVSTTSAAQCGYLLAIGLGLVIAGPNSPTPTPNLGAECRRILTALSAPAGPIVLPDTRATHLGQRPRFDTGDTALDALLTATLNEVGAHGFDGATTAGIARAAGYTEGLLFARYPSKLELFLDASRTQMQAAFSANEDFMAVLASTSSRGVAEAVLIREFMRPETEGLRTLNLEQVRVSWHDAGLRTTVARETEEFIASLIAASHSSAPDQDPVAHYHLGYAISIGLVLLATAHPPAWQLPFDVITVPLEDR